jgi:hypothetical protein
MSQESDMSFKRITSLRTAFAMPVKPARFFKKGGPLDVEQRLSNLLEGEDQGGILVADHDAPRRAVRMRMPTINDHFFLEVDRNRPHSHGKYFPWSLYCSGIVRL